MAEPSNADELITTRIRDALALVDIRVLDHLVVTGDTIVSFAEAKSALISRAACYSLSTAAHLPRRHWLGVRPERGLL